MAKGTCPVVENEQRCSLPIHSYGYCSKHVQRWKRHGDPLKRAKLWRVPIEERLLAHVEYDGSGCWLWTGALQKDEYGTHGGDDGETLVHRSAFKAWVGPIADGLEIDHICRVRRCFNPEHLQAVTHLTNVQRTIRRPHKTHCPAGHPYDEANTRYTKGGTPYCIICHREQGRKADRKRYALYGNARDVRKKRAAS